MQGGWWVEWDCSRDGCSGGWWGGAAAVMGEMVASGGGAAAGIDAAMAGGGWLGVDRCDHPVRRDSCE